MLKEFNHRPLIIGHRGASAHAPENTMAAFTLAAHDKADGIEFDVKLTLDGQIIIMHDLAVDRTTNGTGKVSKLSLAEIRALDAGSHFAPEYQGEKVPLLEEVLQAIPGNIFFNIELTNYSTPFDGLSQMVAKLVKKLDLTERVIFSSFNPINLWLTRKILPETPVAILALPAMPGALIRSGLGRWFAPSFVNPYFSDISATYIEKQHKKNRKVIAWTVNDVKETIRLFDSGIDGIITDDPARMRNVLGVV